MRKVFIALAVSATCSLASASNFTMPSNPSLGFGGQPGALPTVQSEVPLDSIGVAAIPAPGTSVLALFGLAALGRRRRTQ